MENRPVVLGNQDGGTPPNAAPALYVLVKQPQITGKADQGDLVSNQEDSGLASSIAAPVKSKVKTCLPADCTSGSITVTLDNNNMWNEFYYRSTEMILTKQGRRMFPYCRYWITGLDSKLKYILVVDISPVDNLRYKWNGHSWEPSGKAEPHVLGRVFIHPESPSTGRYWMHQPVSFYKLKLTNNTLDQEGHIILHSMHRYLPRLHLVPADKATEVIQLNGPDVHTFIFPQTEFFAVTAYQNIQITQLKIDYNPFAKGFRDDGLSSRFQRDVKQNGSSDQEGGSVNSSPSHHRDITEGEIFDPEQRDIETSLSAMCNTDLERESISPYHDFLGFMETDMCDSPILKQEAPESPIASPCQSHSHVASPLNSNGGINVVVKEEPADDYDYGPSLCMEGIDVKQEEARNMAEEYSDRVDSILEKRQKNHREVGKKEMESESRKRPQTNQLGVAKAKMLKLDSGKMPVVYLAPCSVTKNTVKISALSQAILSLSKSAKSPLSHPLDYLSACFENNSVSRPFTALETEEMLTRKQVSENNVPHKSPTARDVRWKNTETCNSLTITNKVSSCGLKATAYRGPSLANLVGGKTNAFKNLISRKSIVGNQKVRLPGPRKRGRPRKIRFSEVGRPPKYTRKSITTSNYASFGPGNIHLDVKPDLEDVDGVLFVSFASKEALDIHNVDRVEEKEKIQNIQTSSLTTCEKEELQNIHTSSLDACINSDSQRIPQLEKELLEELKSYKYKQVIHPSLREVGLKLNLVDPTMSIDLKYLGVQLPLSYSEEYTLWKNIRSNSTSYDTGLPFVSRTGKTNDFTKIKGWRGKLHSSSKNEGSILEGSLKNRSAFCSDKLDEYLENEGKLMETSMEFSPSTSSCPVVYQLPTKSTSYVRTLDSVLKKQSSAPTASSYTFKPLSVPSVSRKKREKIKNKKQAGSRGKEKSLQKPTIGLPVVTKQRRNLAALEEKVTKSQPSSQAVSEIDNLMASGTEENVQGKQRQAQQQQQSSRLPSLSKTQLKLMDLEVCALWDGKPRTYITEERADLSLSTLLTAQASLKNKPIHQIIKRRAPPCNNDFCRLGCICSSLALEKRQPTHCRKPDCMFGCACLKRKVVLVKGSSKQKKILEESLCGRNRLYCENEVKQQEELMEIEEKKEKLKSKDKKKKKKVEYTICGTEPEKPVKNFPLWVKVDGEMDPEPVYIPTPSTIEPTKSMPPVPEVLTSDGKPASGEGKPATSGVKSARVYAPRPNPVIQEEDKDPVYIYFESMMTCARVRIYDHKKQEKKQQQRCLGNSEKHIEKEHDPEPQPLNLEDEQEPGDKPWWFSCSVGDPSTSYVHHTTRGGTTKLIEIVSDCNWEEDRNEILNILSQHVKNKMPKSLKVGNFVIDLESETKTWDEKNTPVYSSRVKISMLSSQNKGEKAHISVLEASDNRLSPCKNTEKIKFLTAGMLRERRKKGLPFYAGLSPAGKLIAYTSKSDLNSSSLIQVNGKKYPQAKLLLGQMGALHPANRLAAYITGRLRPTMLDLSTLSTAISKAESDAKLAASEPQSAEVPTAEISKTPFSSNTTSTSTVTSPTAHASTQKQIAARPLLHNVASQLVISAIGALHQKVPGTRRTQPVTGPQKFNIKSMPLSPGATTVTPPAITVSSLVGTTASPAPCNKVPCFSDPSKANAVGKPENRTLSTTATRAPVKIAKSPGIATPVATVALPGIGPSTVGIPVSAASLSTILTTTASVTSVPTPTSPVSIAPALSGMNKSPLSNQKAGSTSPPGLSPGAEKRMGPQLLLIPVPQSSPTLRPQQNTQVAQGKRMVLQPLRNPAGVNLYRHPNGQIIQLVPLHQFQPAGPQPSLSPVMLRNPGSVVEIRLPSPSKLPEVSVCQSSVVSSVIPTTLATSVLSAAPPVLSVSPTTNAMSVLPETATTAAASILSGIQTIPAPLMLSVPPTAGVPLGSSVAPSITPMPPASETPSVLPVPTAAEDAPALTMPLSTTEASVSPRTPTAETSLMLPVLPTASPISSATESPSGLSMSPASAVSCAAEAPSASTMAPPTDQMSQAIGSGPTLPISEPVISPVTQAGTLTMRISPLGVIQTTSDSKITCNTSSTPDSADHLIALQSGSFALLQVPGQKKAPNSILKQVEVNGTSQKVELSSIKPEGETRCLQEVEAIGSEVTMSDSRQEENKLPENHLEPSCEKLTRDKNAITSETAEKDAEILAELSSDDPILEPEIASLDRSYISQEIKSGGNKVMANVKHPEDTPNEVSCSSESCSQTAVLAHDALNEQKVAQLKNSNEEEAHSEQTQSTATDSERLEQKQLETDEEMIIELSQKPWDECKVRTNCAEKLEKKPKSYLSPWGNEDQELLGQNTKEKGHSVAAQRDRGEDRRKHKVTSANGRNTILGSKYVNNALEFSYKRDTGVQKDNLTVKDGLVQVSKTWSKTSRPSDALENKNNSGANELVKKFPKCEKQQSILKTSYHRKDSLPDINNITMDNTEKDEKTDDSADEMADEASGYQSEDIVNVETLSESESNGSEENVDIETVEELSEKINIARLKATAAHVILSKQLNSVHDHSSQKIAKTPKPQPELPNKKPKNEEETFSNYRETHTANERRRRKEMRRLFEKLKVTLGLQMVPKVSKCFILKQALEEIQGLTDQADKLLGQKNLLMRKQDTLIRKVSALSGKTQEVVLKKLEYIYAKQKAVEAQKKQQQAEPVDVVETLQTAKPSVENSPSSLFKELKPATLSSKHTKPLILSRKGSCPTGDIPMALTNASLVMTANGQVLAFKSPLVPGQVAAFPSTLLQTELKSEADSSNGTAQPGIASVMIQLPGSAVPVEVKGILPNSTVPITLSAVTSNSPTPVAETAPELTSESEDSFMMPRIVNVTSLATEEDTNLNLDANKDPDVTLDTDSQTPESSLQVASQKTTDLCSPEKAEPSFVKGRGTTGAVRDSLRRKENFPQTVNVSNLKASPEPFATKICPEELAGNQARLKQMNKGSDGQKSRESSFQKLQINEPNDSGMEMELQKVASAIHEPALDASDLMGIEETDDTDETLTSLLNEIAFLNQQLNDDASDISEHPNSLSSGFSLGDMESRRQSTTAEGSPFPFGAMSGSFKDLSIVQESSDSITPLLLHLDDDDLPDGNKNSGDPSSDSEALKIMLGSEVKDPNPDHSVANSGGSGKTEQSVAKTRSVSPPILQMKTNLEAGKADMAWRPMPRLAPLGLKAANFPLESEGQNTKVMPSLAPVASKEIKTAQPVTSPSQDGNETLTLAPAAAESK
ncbi:MAX gene-associated protein-like [Lacerta agilis]|uniref:MAX gene-associated protein-like n=1 Tax=Lacerta agilis TaxID=80427 RepID=UPI001419BE33|nr:MAX gene-associated protein-like [Lacerta agilis]